jgi:hypothetical protein
MYFKTLPHYPPEQTEECNQNSSSRTDGVHGEARTTYLPNKLRIVSVLSKLGWSITTNVADVYPWTD